jgi:hypothetical protein
MSPSVHVFDRHVRVFLEGVPSASARKSNDIASFVVVYASALLAREITPHENGLLGYWAADVIGLLESIPNRSTELPPLLVSRTNHQHPLSQAVSCDILGCD